MLETVFLFLLGLVLLIKGSDWFVDGAVGIAHRFHLPELLIGATIVSIGTTLPEVTVSATSAFSGHGEIAYGNAMGSIICNAALIAAITIAVRPGRIEQETLITPVIFFYGAALFYTVIAYTTGHFNRLHGLILLTTFVVYLIYSVLQMQRPRYDHHGFEQEPPAKAPAVPHSILKDILSLISGASIIAFGANLLVDNGTLIAGALGVPEAVIGLTFVAIGTSLPELATSITALIKGHNALSLGNIIGANLFNLILVSGLAMTLAPFDIPNSAQFFCYNRTLIIDLPMMLLSMLILTVPALIRGIMSRGQGILLLIMYAGFCTLQFL